jgi:3-hydroxy-5-phosphonooxypentane-2,4-dione thiolase
MGRNIFQSDSPVSMLQAVRAVVHNNETPQKALDLYNTLKTRNLHEQLIALSSQGKKDFS